MPLTSERRGVKKLSVIEAGADDEEAAEAAATAALPTATSPAAMMAATASHHFLLPKSYSSGAFASSGFHGDELSPIREIFEAGIGTTTGAHDTATAAAMPVDGNEETTAAVATSRHSLHQRRRSWIVDRQRAVSSHDTPTAAVVDDERRAPWRRRPHSSRSLTSERISGGGAGALSPQSPQLTRAPSVPAAINQFARFKAPMLRR